MKIQKKGLVKMTQDEMLEILKAERYHLSSQFLRDDYVYLIKDNGTDGVFKGFHGKANNGIDAPYLVCPVHTKEAWESYQEAHKPEPTEPQEPEGSVSPVDPIVPIKPVKPSEPAQPTSPAPTAP